jgi:hypothetical protein
MCIQFYDDLFLYEKTRKRSFLQTRCGFFAGKMLLASFFFCFLEKHKQRVFFLFLIVSSERECSFSLRALRCGCKWKGAPRSPFRHRTVEQPTSQQVHLMTKDIFLSVFCRCFVLLCVFYGKFIQKILSFIITGKNLRNWFFYRVMRSKKNQAQCL